MWHDAERRKNDFIATEVHWSEVPGRDEKWKEQTIANTSEEQFRAEHLCEFLGSIGTLINPSKLKTLVYDDPVKRGEKGLDVYEEPKEDHDYLMTADVARGIGNDYSAFIDYSKLAWCAMAVGCCQAVLDYVIPYANERTAFGEPVSHRQAVAFMIADIAIELESMRVLTQRACARADHGLDFHRETYLAHLLCMEKAMKIGSDGVQLLGGHGFTKEHPVERWYRDLRAIAVMQGGLHLRGCHISLRKLDSNTNAGDLPCILNYPES